jgi:flagellar basal body P-ring protein FlgI
MLATVPAVLPKFKPEVASATPQAVPAVMNDVENAGEAAAAVADHVIVDVETAVGAPVVALIAEITTVCVPATEAEVVISKTSGVVVEPFPSFAPAE